MFKTIIGMTGILSLVAVAICSMVLLGVEDKTVVVSLVASIAGFIGTIVGYAYGVEVARNGKK